MSRGIIYVIYDNWLEEIIAYTKIKENAEVYIQTSPPNYRNELTILEVPMSVEELMMKELMEENI